MKIEDSIYEKGELVIKWSTKIPVDWCQKNYPQKLWIAKLPNWLCYLKVIGGALAATIYLTGIYLNSLFLSGLAIPIGIFSGWLDALDGEIARGIKAESNYGKILDAGTDKILMIFVLGTILWVIWLRIKIFSIFETILILTMILAIEELILGSIGIKGFQINKENPDMQGANKYGKVKFTTECLYALIISILLAPRIYNMILNEAIYFLSILGLSIAIYFALRSLIEHIKIYRT